MKINFAKALPRLGAALIALTVPTLILPAHAQTNLNGAGATFPYPLYSKWFDVYKKQTGVQINYQAVGSGAGIKQLVNKTVDFGASDAPLTNSDLSDIQGKIVQIPTVAGAVAVAYNLKGVSGLKLSGPVLADIFLGNIKRWNDSKIAALNAGVKLPASAIAVAHRSDGSGTSYIFTNYLSSASAEWKSKVGAGKSVEWPTGQGGKGNDGVAAAVQQSAGGIGYVELAYAHQNHISVASLQNKSGKFVTPSVNGATAAALSASKATAKDPRSLIVNQAGDKVYPITGYTFIMYFADNSATPKGKEVVKFLKWAMASGQGYAAALDYAPLPRGVVAINKAKLK